MLKSRKGSSRVLFTSILVSFFMAVTLLSYNMAFGTMSDIPYFANSMAWQNASGVISIFDWGILVFMIVMWGSSIILASKIPSNIMFLPVYILFLFIAVYLAGIFSNTFIGMANTSGFQQYQSGIPTVMTLMNNLPKIIGVSGIGLAYALYRKGSKEVGQRASVF